MEKCRTLPEQVVKNTQDIEDILNRPKANIDAPDLLKIMEGSPTVVVDLTEDGQRVEVHLDEIYKSGVDNKLTSLQNQVDNIDVNIYKPVQLQEGTNLLTYNWDSHNNGTYFKGNNLTGVPDGVTGEVMIRLIKSRNTRYAIELYNTGLYEGNTGTYINYHYVDKFEGWEKIQTSLSNDFISKFVPLYDKNNPLISYGKENGLGYGENIVSSELINNIKSYNFIAIKVKDFKPVLISINENFNIVDIGFNIIYADDSSISHTVNYIYGLKIEGYKLTYLNSDSVVYGDSELIYAHNHENNRIVAIYGGNLL